jgi:hypothetical protein
MGTDFQEMTEAELAQQQSRQKVQDPEQPAPRRRGRPAGSRNQPANGANVGEVPQTGFEDECLSDEELVSALQEKLNELAQNQEMAESEFAKPYIEAHKALPGIRKEIADMVPKDGQEHRYRVDRWILKVGPPIEAKEVAFTRRSKQPVTIERDDQA